MFSPPPPQYLAYMQLRTSAVSGHLGGFVKPKMLWYAPRQPMVALRLDNPAGTQSLAQVSPPPNNFFVRPRLIKPTVVLATSLLTVNS